MLYLYVCRLASGGAEKKLAEPPPASEAVMPLYLPLTMRLYPLWCFVFYGKVRRKAKRTVGYFNKNGQFFTLVSLCISFYKFQ